MNRRYAQIMLGLFLLFVGLSSIVNGEPVGVLAGLGGFYMLARQFEESRGNREQEREADLEYERWRAHRQGGADYDFGSVRDEVDRNPTTNADRVYSHALKAVQSAGLDPSTTPVLPVDIGVIAYKGEEQTFYRMRDIPNDVDYVQPLVELRLPQKAQGRITFELLDDRGEVVFLRTEEHEFNRGRNLIMPSRRVPVHDALEMDEGGWTLRVSADGMLLAVHTFDWRESEENIAAEYLADDGEISNELRAAMAESRLENMSLDELLSFQDDEPARKSSAT